MSFLWVFFTKKRNLIDQKCLETRNKTRKQIDVYILNNQKILN